MRWHKKIYKLQNQSEPILPCIVVADKMKSQPMNRDYINAEVLKLTPVDLRSQPSLPLSENRMKKDL